MTQSPTPPPNDPRQDEPRANPSRTGALRPLEFDEMVALFVAFLSLGGVLLWGLTRGNLSLLGESGAMLPGSIVTETEEALEDGPAVVPGDADAEGASVPVAPPANRVTAEVVDADGDPNGSSLSELSARAAARRERLASRKPVWEDLRDGMVGTAAGVAGASAVADGASAEPVTPEEPATAAAPDVSASETEPDVAAAGTATPSEAASGEPAEAIAFADVEDGYWAKPYIDALSSRGLISGYEDGSFKPDAEVTRAQAANIISRTFDLTADKEAIAFSDVSEDYWARESIGEVVKGGFMTGFPDDTFDPGAAVTRAQTLTTLVTGLNIETPTNVQAALDRYSDANQVPNWANEKVAAATAGSLVVNHPNVAELNPEEPTTRAELSAMIYQALVREGIVDPIESEYVVKP
ncbi:MAG: S-layer homology domain-containing protein [Cyanobacteria bacterium J06634_6]